MIPVILITALVVFVLLHRDKHRADDDDNAIT
jgi:hypothetical protein